jgi:hypothetical protein
VLQRVADGLAVISAIMAAADPCQAAREFNAVSRSALTDMNVSGEHQEHDPLPVLL